MFIISVEIDDNIVNKTSVLIVLDLYRDSLCVITELNLGRFSLWYTWYVIIIASNDPVAIAISVVAPFLVTTAAPMLSTNWRNAENTTASPSLTSLCFALRNPEIIDIETDNANMAQIGNK